MMDGYFGFSKIWVGDIDAYVYIDHFDRENMCEQDHEVLERKWREVDLEYEKIGGVALLDLNFISPVLFKNKGVSPEEWRWAIHQAGASLEEFATGQLLERSLISALVNLGRAYAVARYAKWEKIPYPSALTATLPLGFRALLLQYLGGQGLLQAGSSRERVRMALELASEVGGKVAYQRAGIIQALIHDLAIDAPSQSGSSSLHRDATRIMLSLARLRYSVEELHLNNFLAAAELPARYAQIREEMLSDGHDQGHWGRHIPNWRMRHLRPLIDLFPYSIRGTFDRIVRHVASGKEVHRNVAVNELAIAHCGIMLMRKKSYRGGDR